MGFLSNIRIYLQNRSQWEDICDKCGLCCYERDVYDDGEMAVDLSAPCEFLNTETNRCTIYDHRFDTCPECKKVTFRKAISKDKLPPSCAYRRLFSPNQ